MLACWGIGVGVVLFWVLVSPVWGWLSVLAILGAVCAGVTALVSWRTNGSGQLTWDGECWHWDAIGDLFASKESTLSVIADVQSALLLLFETSGSGRRWFWVERVSRPERWMDLRRAVYASHREPVPFAPSGN